MQIKPRRYFYFICIFFCCCNLFSCSSNQLIHKYSIDNYPVDTPFVFNNKIILKGNLTKDEKTRLELGLVNYWADSLYALKEQQLGLFYKIKNPPIFDTLNIGRTEVFMKGYLKSQGYYYAQMKITHIIDTVPDYDVKNYKQKVTVTDSISTAKINALTKSTYKNLKKIQQRVTVVDTVYPGKPTIIDSEQYALDTPRLQMLADSSKKASLIEPGKTLFGQNLVGNELNRLVTLYRQRGYFLMTRDNLIAEADTVDQSLINFSLDPFEQAQKIAEGEEHKKGNPTTSITVKQRYNTDTTAHLVPDSLIFKRYKVGNIYFYPEADFNALADSLIKDTSGMHVDRYNEYTMYYKRHLFYLTLLRNLSTLHAGRLYNDNTLTRTITNFNQLPAWRQEDYRTMLRGDSVDFYFFLSPARPGNISLSVEGSRNTGDFLTTGTLIGTAFNIGYTAPNLFKSAVQYSVSFSNGVEFTFDPNYPFLQTFLSSLNNTFSIPNAKVWSPINGPIRGLHLDKFHLGSFYPFDFVNDRGIAKISLTGSYADRNDFFRLRTAVLSYGYEWRKKNTVYQLRFPGSVELYSLDTLPQLDSAFKENPFLRTSFNTGIVVSLLQAAVTNTHTSIKNPNNTIYWRGGFEESGAIADVITSWQDQIYRYVKFEGEYRWQHKWAKTSLAMRGLFGLGINYGNTAKFGNTLPFFKQFFAGGPNSMRAWGLRELGLGSSVVSDTSTFNERYGDLQLEANIEYRFPIASFGSVNISSAFFIDAGNVWNIRKDASIPGADFNFDKLGKDIAIGTGTGLRMDFSYFLIRLDFGVKVKDPAKYEDNGWNFPHFNWRNTEYSQYGVTPRNNYAFQLGIGLPF